VNITKSEAKLVELIEKAWADGKKHERKNLIEVLERLRQDTSVKDNTTLVLESLITVLKDDKVA
jgi:hypothetical protein